jgi:hypothetical protein
LANFQELITATTEGYKNDLFKDLELTQNKISGAKQSATPYDVAFATDI